MIKEQLKELGGLYLRNYVNTKLLFIASAWAESLGNRPILGQNKNVDYVAPGVIPTLPSIKLIDINRSPLP